MAATDAHRKDDNGHIECVTLDPGTYILALSEALIVLQDDSSPHRRHGCAYWITYAVLIVIHTAMMQVTAAHFIAIPVDNCSINPARSFGVSAISGNWKDHWVVSVAVCCGEV
jgi:glycerol uptake facilitator-like aquaporin